MNALKKNWYFVVPAVLILVPLLMTGFIAMRYDYSMADAWLVFKTSGQANTKFQTIKFSESAFKKVVPGMNGRQVYELLGTPLERHEDDTLWKYSLPVSAAEYYHERTIVMQPGTGKVASVIKRYHTPETKQ